MKKGTNKISTEKEDLTKNEKVLPKNRLIRRSDQAMERLIEAITNEIEEAIMNKIEETNKSEDEDFKGVNGSDKDK